MSKNKVTAFFSPESLGAQTVALVLFSVLFGFARQWAPGGIDWNGRWPTDANSAREAYDMMARPDDPPFISLEEVIELHNRRVVTLVDARSTEEFEKGRIPGAVSVPYYDFVEDRESYLRATPRESPLIVYCEGIGCELSFFLARELTLDGYHNIRIFYGGYPEWQQAGLAVEK